MNLKKIAYIIFIVSFIILLLSLINFFSSEKVLDARSFYTSATVSDRAGFDLNNSALTFGKIPSQGNAVRNIIVTNGFSFDVVAEIGCEGKICALLWFEEKVFLNKNEERKVSFVADVGNTPQGFYDGNITVKLKRRTGLF